MIEVKHIKKQFVSPKKYPGLKGAVKGLFSREKVVKTAVDDISFTINDGEIVGYIGSNGAGKSTTIKIMTGIMHPTAGECLVNGIDPNKHRKENAGFPADRAAPRHLPQHPKVQAGHHRQVQDAAAPQVVHEAHVRRGAVLVFHDAAHDFRSGAEDQLHSPREMLR